MKDNGQCLFSTGIYSVPDAARLTRVSTWRIRRWLRGYKFRYGQKQYQSKPLWQGQLQTIDGSLALGFLDLIEILFVDSFLTAGVSWAVLRKAHERGSEVFKNSHPFCTMGFFTDGRKIFAKLHEETEEPSLIEIAENQTVFTEITKPFFKQLEFGTGDALLRWRPRTTRRLVVLDPKRNFGRPIVLHHGIPTEVLATAVRACGSITEVSKWYEVPEAEISDAVEFEQKLAA